VNIWVNEVSGSGFSTPVLSAGSDLMLDISGLFKENTNM
jgi:hypothetical protein